MKTNHSRTRRRKPIEIKDGNVTVKIYVGTNRVGGTSYPQYTLAYRLARKRERRRFADLDEATREAQFVAKSLANGEHGALKLTARDRELWVAACDQLRPFNVPIDRAVHEYVTALNALKGLPEGTSLMDAVDFFKRRSPAGLPKRTVREVVDELLTAKRQAGRSDVHLKDLESRLGRFADAFGMNIAAVTGQMIQHYIDAMKGGGRSKRNTLATIRLLFRFASRRRYMPKDTVEEVEAVEKPKLDHTEIEVFTPAELRDLFAAARPELIPWLAISAFAGLRNAEVQRLDWSEIDLKARHIEVTAGKAKTRSRRLVPITPNLFEWLVPYAQASGPVTPFTSIWNQIGWLTDDVNAVRKEQRKPKFTWKHNGLRHSYISHRVAVVKDVAQVALECGNSPQMIFSSYRALTTEAEANEWFGIRPARTVNMVPLAAG